MSGITDREDFPQCVFCDEKIYIMGYEADLVRWVCAFCGGVMEVSLLD